MKLDFNRRKMTVVIILVALIVVVAAVFVTRTFFKPARLASETAEQIGKRFVGGGFDFGENSRELIPFSKLISGGPPKDGIPSIDEPKYLKAEDASFLSDDELVLGVEIAGEAAAFPIKILNWHEIVNTEIGRVPVAITYCPLCFSGVTFKRVIDGQEVEFGVSGKLYNNDLVMYNRRAGNLKENLWQQITGQAIVGELAGARLEKITTDTIEWSNWRKAHPDTQVLSTDTGFSRDYDTFPYGDYNTSREVIFPLDNEDNRLHPKAQIYGVELNGKFKAYPKDEIEKITEVKDKIGPEEVVVKRDPVTGQVRFFDKEGKEINSIFQFWFSWASFHPETELYISRSP